MTKQILSILIITILTKSAIANTNQNYSQALAENFSHAQAELFPERASFIGYPEYDGKATQISKDFDQKVLDFYYQWLRKIKSINTKRLTKDELLDTAILKSYIQDQINAIEVNHQEKLIPFIPGTEFILENLNKLSKSEYSDTRKRATLLRFHEYVETEFLKHAAEYMQATIDKYPDNLAIYPYQQQVQTYLSTSQRYVNSTQKLLEEFKDSSYKKDFDVYTQQVDVFDNFIRTKFLPKTTQKPGLSPAIYRVLLAKYGIENINFAMMIKKGKRDYARVYKQYLRLAEQIANKYHLSDKSPLAVINYLKTNKISSPTKILTLYQKMSLEIDELIRNKQLITLPNSPLKIRLSGLSESKMHPAPRMIIPPSVNPKGLVPVFVVPISDSGLPYDDFTYPAITVALLAHEGRPGHDLHYRSLTKGKINLIRAYYSKHSTETEGWALYAEDMIYPYVGLEEKFGILQLKLQRLARYFLDPLVQLNEITRDEVIAILHNEVGLSKEFAEVEYKRYAYLLPGQAPSYYYGLLKIQALKSHLTKKFGNLNEQCFNDTLLSFGMIPIKYIYKFEERFDKCKQ